MKIFFIIALCCFVEIFADRNYDNKYTKSMRVCSRKTQLKIYNYSDYVRELDKGGKQIQLFSKCLLEQLDCLSSNGSILYEEFKKTSPISVSSKMYSNIVDRCKNETGNDTSEMYNKFLKCLLNNTNSQYQEHILQKYQQALKTCSQKTNPAFEKHEAYAEALVAGGVQIERFSECLLRELNCLDKNGAILYEEVKKTYTQGVSPEIYATIVDRCKTLKGNNTAETSYKFSNCVINNVSRIQEQQRYKRAVKFCSDKFEPTFRSHKIQNRALEEGGKQIQLYSECVFQELGYLDGNGTILYEKIKKSNIDGDDFENYPSIVDKCKSERGNTTAETCYKFRKCLKMNILKSQEQQKNLRDRCQKAIRMCSQKTNRTFRSYDEYVKTLAVGDEQLQAFSECVLQELGYLDTNGTILYEELKNATIYDITREKYHKIIDQCKTEKGNTTTVTSYKFVKCFLTNIKRAYDQQKPLHQRLRNARVFCSEKINHTFQRHHDERGTLDAGGYHLLLYSECLLRELGYLDDNGTILYEEFKTENVVGLSHEKYSRIVDKCKSVRGNNVSETCYKFRKCLTNNIFKTQEEQTPLDDRLHRAIRVCFKKTHGTIRNYNEFIKELLVGGQQVHFTSECILQELGYLDSNGTIQYDELRNTTVYNLARESYQSVVDECKILKGSNTTETAYKFCKCFFTKLKKVGDQEKPFYLRDWQARRICSEKTNRTFERSKIYYKALLEGGEQIQSFCKCMFQELNYLDGNGSILYEQVKKNPPLGMSHATYSTFVDQCKNKVGNNTAETCYKFLKCVKTREQYKSVNQKRERARSICSSKTQREFLKDDVYISALASGGESIQLYCECMLNELGYLSRYGSILYEEIKRDPIEGVSLEKQASVIDKCRIEVGSSPRETSYKFTKCYVNNIMKAQQ